MVSCRTWLAPRTTSRRLASEAWLFVSGCWMIGAGAAALMTAGVGASPAIAVALAVGALGVLTGGAVVLSAIVRRLALTLLPARLPA